MSDAIVVKVRYTTTSNVGTACRKWGKYATNKKKADATKIDKNNLINDYMNYTSTDVSFNEKSESYSWGVNGDINCLEDIKANDKLNRKGIVWDMVFSFTPEFALNNGLVTKQDYYKMTLNVMPSFLTELGFKINNTTWYATLHRNTVHPHIHLLFYEHEPSVSFKAIPKSNLSKLKSKIVNYILNNKDFYVKRDKEFQNITGLVKANDLSRLRKRNLFDDKFRKNLNNMFLDLYKDLPKTGRLQYNSKNMLPYKNKIDAIINYILMSDNIKYDYEKYYSYLNDFQKQLNMVYGNSNANKNNKYVDDQLNKLYTRIGNDILHNFKVYNSLEVIDREKEFLKKHIMEMNFKSRDYAKNKTREDCAKSLFILSRVAGLNSFETKKLFDKWIKKSKYVMDSNYLIDYFYSTNTNISSTEYYNCLKKLGYDYEKYSKFKSKYFYQELSYKRLINNAVDYLMSEIEHEKEKIIEEQIYELEYNEYK